MLFWKEYLLLLVAHWLERWCARQLLQGETQSSGCHPPLVLCSMSDLFGFVRVKVFPILVLFKLEGETTRLLQAAGTDANININDLIVNFLLTDLFMIEAFQAIIRISQLR
jgi:hypothetical protein